MRLTLQTNENNNNVSSQILNTNKRIIRKIKEMKRKKEKNISI